MSGPAPAASSPGSGTACARSLVPIDWPSDRTGTKSHRTSGVATRPRAGAGGSCGASMLGRPHAPRARSPAAANCKEPCTSGTPKTSLNDSAVGCQNDEDHAATHLIRQGHRAPGPDGRHHVPARRRLRRAGRGAVRRGASAILVVVDRRRPRRSSSSSRRTSSRCARWAPARSRRRRRRELHAMIERLCVQADLPKPKVAVANTAMPNAFALGRSPKNATVCATTGIMELLSPAELEGVMAHELTHVANRDVMIMTIAALLRHDRRLHRPVRLLLRRRLERRRRQPGLHGPVPRLDGRLRRLVLPHAGAVALPRVRGRPRRGADHRPPERAGLARC